MSTFSKLLLIGILLTCSLSTQADTILQKDTVVIIQQMESQGLTEGKAYQLLYENAKSSNDKTISITQWTIGIALSILLAILFSQIFFNYRISKKEIDYIKKDIDEKHAVLKEEMTNALLKASSKAHENIDVKVSSIEKDLKEAFKERFDNKMRFFDLRNDSIEKEVERKIKSVELQIEKNEGDIWLLKGVSANALSSFLRSAFFQIDLKREIKYILDDIISILSSLDEIHQSDEERLNQLIEKLDAKYSDQKEKIIALYVGKPVYKFVEGTAKVFAQTFGTGPIYGNKQYVKNPPASPSTFSPPLKS